MNAIVGSDATASRSCRRYARFPTGDSSEMTVRIALATFLALSLGCRAAPPPAQEPRKHVHDPRIPAASGDYSSVLADVEEYRNRAIGFDELQRRTLARRLPPHPLGCAYLMTPVPPPPPGTPFDPWMMPMDWEHNWGEVAMTFWVGRLSAEDHRKLHAAAHPTEPPL